MPCLTISAQTVLAKHCNAPESADKNRVPQRQCRQEQTGWGMFACLRLGTAPHGLYFRVYHQEPGASYLILGRGEFLSEAWPDNRHRLENRPVPTRSGDLRLVLPVRPCVRCNRPAVLPCQPLAVAGLPCGSARLRCCSVVGCPCAVRLSGQRGRGRSVIPVRPVRPEPAGRRPCLSGVVGVWVRRGYSNPSPPSHPRGLVQVFWFPSPGLPGPGPPGVPGPSPSPRLPCPSPSPRLPCPGPPGEPGPMMM